jgi:hypothetical protein
MNPIPKDLMAILVCPKCRAPVTQQDDTLRCTAPGCGLIYPIRDGIPVMLVEEARPPETGRAAASP